MKLFVLLLQLLPVDMRVNLCGGDVGMTEHLLHGTQIGSAFKQMRCKRMAECVRMNILCDACLFRVLQNNLPDRNAGEGGSPNI